MNKTKKKKILGFYKIQIYTLFPIEIFLKNRRHWSQKYKADTLKSNIMKLFIL